MPRAPRKPVLTVVGVSADPAWLVWYNKANADEQRKFDNAAGVIDRGGKPYEAGGSEYRWYDNFKSDPPLHDALISYRDTGGRRALFAPPVVDHGTKPISVTKPGGPIESVGGIVVLHPGRYSYTATKDADKAFRAWLDRSRPNVSVGAQQVSEAVLGGAPYYTDFELRVWKDTPWATDVPGLPTWLPEGVTLESYWGKPTEHAKPDWEILQKEWDFGKTALTLVVVAGAVYLLGELRPRQIAR